MEQKHKSVILVQTKIDAPILLVWKCWTTPADIVKWNHASDDWHTTLAENDLRSGGKFLSRMEAKDGSAGFNFEGVYEQVIQPDFIRYTLADGRRVEISFAAADNTTTVTESFEAEGLNTAEMQRAGWQSILENFKKYTESNYVL